MVGPSEGKLLHLLLRLVGARRVVEVGTLVGYSAIHMARALPAGRPPVDDRVRAPARRARARQPRRRRPRGSGHGRWSAPASTCCPALEQHGPFDAVFIDADKANYDRYGAWAIEHLRRGGLVLGDNAYLFGELLDDDERGRAMRAFHELVAAACDSVCIPTPDGLVLGIKR